MSMAEAPVAPGLWARRLGWLSLSPSHSAEYASLDVDFKFAAKVPPETILPGAIAASEQIKAGLVLTKKLAKYMIEAAGYCDKSSAQVKECLTRMYDIYHQQKGTATDHMQEHVALCFEAATSLALLTDNLTSFANSIQKEIGEPMLEMSRKSAEHHNQIMTLKDDMAKNIITKRSIMVRQRAICRNNWNKIRHSLRIINDQEFKAELIDVEDGFGNMFTGIVNRTMKTAATKKGAFPGNDFAQAQESFQTLERIVDELNADENDIRTVKIPKFFGALEALENQRLESIEVSMEKYSKSLKTFVDNVSSLRNKVTEKLYVLDRRKFMDEWTSTFEKSVKQGVDGANVTQFQLFTGLPCQSSEFRCAIRDGEAAISEELLEALKLEFRELAELRDLSFNSLKTTPFALDEDVLEAKRAFEKRNQKQPSSMKEDSSSSRQKGKHEATSENLLPPSYDPGTIALTNLLNVETKSDTVASSPASNGSSFMPGFLKDLVSDGSSSSPSSKVQSMASQAPLKSAQYDSVPQSLSAQGPLKSAQYDSTPQSMNAQGPLKSAQHDSVPHSLVAPGPLKSAQYDSVPQSLVAPGPLKSAQADSTPKQTAQGALKKPEMAKQESKSLNAPTPLKSGEPAPQSHSMGASGSLKAAKPKPEIKPKPDVTRLELNGGASSSEDKPRSQAESSSSAIHKPELGEPLATTVGSNDLIPPSAYPSGTVSVQASMKKVDPAMLRSLPNRKPLQKGDFPSVETDDPEESKDGGSFVPPGLQ